MKRCEIAWCGKKTDKPVYVNENIGDGSWRVCICQDCATKLGLKAGDDLPSTPEIKRRLGITNYPGETKEEASEGKISNES